jgi:hypothetical protein
MAALANYVPSRRLLLTPVAFALTFSMLIADQSYTAGAPAGDAARLNPPSSSLSTLVLGTHGSAAALIVSQAVV